MGLRLEVGLVLERWSRGAVDGDRQAVYEMLFALVEGRGAAYSLHAVDPSRRMVVARVTDDVVVRMRMTDDDRIRVLEIGPGEEV